LKKPDRLFTSSATYSVHRALGQGGNATVFAVTEDGDDPRLQLAAKLLEPENSRGEKWRRFRNELFFCTHSRHENVVKVVDHGFSEGSDAAFYIMESYDGSLRKALKENWFGPDQALTIFRDIVNGVEHAHTEGVIHRDLKPENVLLDKSLNRTVVADFGIAKYSLEAATDVKTRAGQRMANRDYASPEQRRGENATTASDVFALGLMLHELFMGMLPEGTQYPAISSQHPEFAFLDRVVERLIAADPETRIASRNILATIDAASAAQAENDRIQSIRTALSTDPAITDSLILNPVSIKSRKVHEWNLTIELSQPVNNGWYECFLEPENNGLGNWTTFPGRSQSECSWSPSNPSHMTITVDTNDEPKVLHWAQRIMPEFINQANTAYRVTIEHQTSRDRQKRLNALKKDERQQVLNRKLAQLES